MCIILTWSFCDSWVSAVAGWKQGNSSSMNTSAKWLMPMCRNSTDTKYLTHGIHSTNAGERRPNSRWNRTKDDGTGGADFTNSVLLTHVPNWGTLSSTLDVGSCVNSVIEVEQVPWFVVHGKIRSESPAIRAVAAERLESWRDERWITEQLDTTQPLIKWDNAKKKRQHKSVFLFLFSLLCIFSNNVKKKQTTMHLEVLFSQSFVWSENMKHPLHCLLSWSLASKFVKDVRWYVRFHHL